MKMRENNSDYELQTEMKALYSVSRANNKRERNVHYEKKVFF